MPGDERQPRGCGKPAADAAERVQRDERGDDRRQPRQTPSFAVIA